MADIELSSYVTGLASATLTGTEEVYLVGDEKTTTQDIADLGNSNIRVWKAQISQTGTSAPTLVELVNTLGVTLTPAYSAVGQYTISGFSGNLTGLIEVSISSGYDETLTTEVTCTTSSILRIKTYASGVASDDIFTNAGLYLGTCVLTIIKYD